jgi:hypothetical protein
VTTASPVAAGTFAAGQGCQDVALTPGQACHVPVTFTAAAPGAQSGTVTVTPDAGSPFSGKLTGTGLQPALSVTDPAGRDALANPETLGAAAQTVTLTVRNTGTYPLTGTIALTSGAPVFAVPGQGGSKTTCSPSQLSLDVNETCQVEIDYNCATGAGTLTLQTDDAPVPARVTHTVGLSVDAANQVACGRLTVSDVGFGTVRTGSPATRLATVTNAGQRPVGISGVQVSGTDFASGGGTLCPVLQPGRSCQVPVTFTPSAPPRAETGTLTVTDAGGRAAAATLTGTGQQPALAITDESSAAVTASLKFGNGANRRVVTLTNTGSGPDPLTGGVTTPAGGVFVLNDARGTSQTTCSTASLSLAAGASCTIELDYVCGTAPDTLTIVTNDAPVPQQVTRRVTLQVDPADPTTCGQIRLRIANGAPQPAIDVAFGARTTGTTAEIVPHVVNVGTQPVTIVSIVLTGSSTFGTRALGTTDCAIGTTVDQAHPCAIDVTFTPTVAFTTQAGTLTVTDSNGNVTTANLTGTGAQAPPR